MTWRLVDSDLLDPARSAALDEAVLIARGEGRVPNTVHLYRRDRPAVSLGYFERLAGSVDLAVAEAKKVEIVRRMSGGSAVYTDQNQVIYSVAVDDHQVPESPAETFEKVCQGLVYGLLILGINAEFKPINDILVRGRKISGSAQVRRSGVMLQHGTVLVSNDYDRMLTVLRSGKRGREGLTSVTEELAIPPSMDMLKKALVCGFAEAFKDEFYRDDLTEYEEEMADHLVRTKYGTMEHTYLY